MGGRVLKVDSQPALEGIQHIVLVFPLLTLNKQMSAELDPKIRKQFLAQFQ